MIPTLILLAVCLTLCVMAALTVRSLTAASRKALIPLPVQRRGVRRR